jgi:hypothetical protein
VKRFLGIAGSLALSATLIAGCSSAVSPSSLSNIASAAVDVPVLITDAPSDQLLAFTLTLNSIVLTDSAGKTASILATPTTIEVCHLNGMQEALVTAKIPQDTYTSATITFSSPQITYIDTTTKLPISVTPTLATTSYTITFPTAITVSNTSTSLLIDLLAGQSVAISGTTVTVSPVFIIKPVPPATALPPVGLNGTGMEQHGTVVSASGTTLVVQPPSGANITFTTNTATSYQGVSGLTALTAGELVEVDFSLQTGGVLLANRVELEPPPPAGIMPNKLSGPVTSVAAGTGFKMVLMQGCGSPVPVASSVAASIFAVTTSATTVFAITPQFISMTGLPFTPSFSSTNITAGQTVGVVASSITGTTAVAANVYLIPQTVGGTVTAKSIGGNYTVYTITLASGSAFASLSGATTITVYTSTATAVPSATNAIAVGSTVRFNGLVFKTGTTFSMVAGCSPDGDPRI